MSDQRAGTSMLRAALIVVAMMAATTASAKDTTTLALNLGSVLAAEEGCGLEYDQAAIAAFIQKSVPADDRGFPSTLNMMTDGSKVQFDRMTTSSKTAHCAQIKRLAKTYGFVK